MFIQVAAEFGEQGLGAACDVHDHSGHDTFALLEQRQKNVPRFHCLMVQFAGGAFSRKERFLSFLCKFI